MNRKRDSAPGMKVKVSPAMLAASMEGYGQDIDDALEKNEWELDGNELQVYAIIDLCPECGTYQRKSELKNHPDDDGAYICRTCLRDYTPVVKQVKE